MSITKIKIYGLEIPVSHIYDESTITSLLLVTAIQLKRLGEEMNMGKQAVF